MIVMPANNTGIDLGILIGKYPGKVGHLYSPGKNPTPRQEIPYALDNLAYVTWRKGKPFNDDAFRQHVRRFALGRIKPLWILVPDVVTDAWATQCKWVAWEDELRAFGLPLAFAVQDGMNLWEVPKTADVIFVGGSTEWKWKTLHMWAAKFPRVHVGRVNGIADLWTCHDFGVESCDGTGWYRGDQNQLDGLKVYLAESTGRKMRQQRQMHEAFSMPAYDPVSVAREIGPDDER